MKKIMFNDRYGLTQAVLEGKKTMTRRLMSKTEAESLRNFRNEPQIVYDAKRGDFMAFRDDDDIEPTILLPRYKVGEELAVAQCYEDAILDVGEEEWNKRHKWYCIENLCKRAGLHNKMFVQADLMPHRIHVTDIQLQRLNNISDEDCLREGVVKWIDCYIVSGIMENQGKNNVCFDTQREAFAALIDRINGKGTWDSNPWVYAYTFELLR